MSTLGKVLLTGGKIVGTIGLGVLGLVAKGIDSGVNNLNRQISDPEEKVEASPMLSSFGDACFKSAKRLWTNEDNESDDPGDPKELYEAMIDEAPSIQLNNLNKLRNRLENDRQMCTDPNKIKIIDQKIESIEQQIKSIEDNIE